MIKICMVDAGAEIPASLGIHFTASANVPAHSAFGFIFSGPQDLFHVLRLAVQGVPAPVANRPRRT